MMCNVPITYVKFTQKTLYFLNVLPRIKSYIEGFHTKGGTKKEGTWWLDSYPEIELTTVRSTKALSEIL